MAKKKQKAAKAKSKPAKSTKAAKPAKKSKAGGKKSLAPKAVKTGKGASPMEVGQALVAMVRAGQFDPNTQLWAPKFSSIEGLGVSQEWTGGKAVAAKNQEFHDSNIIHSCTVDGPFVGATGFAVHYAIDVECKTDGSRKTMTEVGVYTVKNGKIIREEFMYAAG